MEYLNPKGLGHIDGVIWSRGIPNIFIDGQTLIHPHILQVDGINIHHVQVGLFTFNMEAWGLGRPNHVHQVLVVYVRNLHTFE